RMTPSAHSLDMARRLPLSELEIIPDSGHMMVLEHYPQVNAQLRALVARVHEELARDAAQEAELLAEAGLADGSGERPTTAGLRLPQP
ncbi:MAG TPA: alpha/beta hydrolase, partial [Candidatus Nanopelagicales bacterium]